MPAVFVVLLFMSALFLTACGGGGGSSGGGGSPSPPITPTPTNNSPIANAGADQLNIDELSTVVISGSTSNDPDNDPLTFQWTQVSGLSVVLSNETQATPSFTAPATNNPIDLIFELTVNDGNLDSAVDQVMISIVPLPNQQPLVDAGLDQNNAGERSVIILNGAGSSDPDGDSLIYHWSQTAGPSINLSDSDSATPSFTAPSVLSSLVYSFQLIVNDGEADSVSDAVSITVVNDETAPTVDIDFPTVKTLTSESNITVHGTSQDATKVESVLVNGISATSDNEFLSWQVTIPLNLGENNIAVQASDASLNTNGAAAQFNVSRKNLIQGLIGTALDTVNNILYGVDPALDSLIAINLSTDLITIISSPNTGSGPSLEQPQYIVLDIPNQRAVITDVVLKSLISIDLITGDREIVSSNSVGLGPEFVSMARIDFDPDTNRIFILDRGINAVLAVDLTTGNRSILSDDTYDTNIPFTNLASLSFDRTNKRLFVGAGSFGAIQVISVNTTNGNQTIISDAAGAIGIGPAISGLNFMVYEGSNNLLFAYTMSSGTGTMYSIDPASGNRSIVSPNTVSPYLFGLLGSGDLNSDPANNQILGTFGNNIVSVKTNDGSREDFLDTSFGFGQGFAFVTDIAMDPETERLFVLQIDSVLEIDIQTGNRSIVTGLGRGTGPALDYSKGFALDIGSNTIYIVDSDLSAIIEIDITNGNRRFVSSSNHGVGPNFRFPEALALDVPNNIAYVVDHTGGWGSMIAVDLLTGDRTIINAGLELSFYKDIELDLVNNLAYVPDSNVNVLLTIDLTSGERNIFPGSGRRLSNPSQINLDLSNNLAYVLDGGLVEINLATGVRTLMADKDTGSGVYFGRLPSSIAMDTQRNRIFGITNKVLLIHPQQGDRVILSED